MITVITVAREAKQLRELLRDEARAVKQIESDGLVSLCFEIDVPFELTAEEEMRHIARVLCRSAYKEVPLTSKEKSCIVGNFLEAGQAVYLTKRKQGV